ncbi:MAG: YihA family ribosome biogenesis GTP-binding protein [Pseudomonadales bacterium]|nr:YihA family ribosome biogenesis GTP-binding protein [Pseudomonadales bacterium]MCP5183519.1 YihA family ribosome biogenesis GTP-binding protein [Pseudomonadales bacterium]
MTESDRSDAPRLAATFLTSAPDLRRCPAPAGPEIAIAGRSNAGKSSVLNRLTGNRNTARVSKTPGRTQLLNFFELPNGNRLVDLPGYGYAAAGRSAQAAWQEAVNDYLGKRHVLRAVVLVMDIRHPLQPFDQELLDWGHASDLPVHVLLNKADKLGNAARTRVMREVTRTIGPQALASVQLFSATSGMGVAALLDRLNALWAESEVESPGPGTA